MNSNLISSQKWLEMRGIKLSYEDLIEFEQLTDSHLRAAADNFFHGDIEHARCITLRQMALPVNYD